MKKENIGYLQIILAGIIAGLMPIIFKFASSLGAYSVVFFKIIISTIFLSFFFIFAKKKLSPFKYERKKLLVFGALHGFITLGYFLTIQYTTVAIAVLLVYLAPLWMVIFSKIILKEKITKEIYPALILGLAGITILISPENFFRDYKPIFLVIGLLAGVGSAFVYTLSKTFKKYNKPSLTFWQNIVAIPFALPLLFVITPKFTIVNTTAIFVLGILSVLGFILVYTGLGKVKANKGGIVMLLEIVFPVILAYFIFNEVPSPNSILGGCLIILAVLIVTLSKNK